MCTTWRGSHEVRCSFSTIRLSSPQTRVCLTRYVPPPGFLTLLTAYSSTGYPALFHAGALMEFCPSELFPRPEPRRLSTPDALLPLTDLRAPRGTGKPALWDGLGSAPSALRPGSAEPGHITSSWRFETCSVGSTSGLCSPERVRCDTRGGLDHERARCSLGISCFYERQLLPRAPTPKRRRTFHEPLGPRRHRSMIRRP